MSDVSNDAYLSRMAIVEACMFISSPHARMRPRVYPDGNQWCALYGEDLMMGVCGFGDTPEAACADFDKNWSLHRAAAPTFRKAAEEITCIRADLAAVTKERDRMREALKPLIEIEDYPDTILMKRIRDLRAALEGVTEPPR